MTEQFELIDARGVEIRAGDVVIYGFGVGRSVAMAEGVVLFGADNVREVGMGIEDWKPSVTKTGRVRIRVVRRSYGGGEKPVVDIQPDRLVVLKPGFNNQEEIDPDIWSLPPSPLPTQDEANYTKVVENIERHQTRVDQLRAGADMAEHEARVGGYYPDYTYDYSMDRRRYWIGLLDKWCAEERSDLGAICQRLGRDMPV